MSEVYFSNSNLLIRSMEKSDAQIIYDTYLSYGWHPSLETYENYYKEQEANERKVFIAEYEGKVSGLCTLVLNPTEGPWAGMGYPEIVDLTVFFHVHNRGIGNKLLDAVEQEAAKVADAVYLAVGVHSGSRIFFLTSSLSSRRLMVREKMIQIPELLYLQMSAYILTHEDASELYQNCKKGIFDKMERQIDHELYSTYKTGATPEQREKARQEYLERAGIPKDFRW